MSLESVVQSGLDFFSAHPFITIAILVVVGVLAYFKFKLVLKIGLAGLILGLIVYVILFLADLTSTGVEHAEKFLSSPDQTINKLKKLKK